MNKFINKKTLLNTLKIVSAAAAAVMIASLLRLEFAVSAGIVAILSVAPTKKETIKTALGRFLAFICALGISFACFSIGGYNMYSFLVYLLIFIFICQACGWISAMAMDSVLISHFLTLGNMNLKSLTNEILLFVIGVSLGILVNLHLKKNVEKIERMKDEVDDEIKSILYRMSLRVTDKKLPDYDGSCFDSLWDKISIAEKTAQKNYLNEMKSDSTDKNYISMRRKQASVLMEMYKKVRILKTSPETASVISDFLKKVSEEYSRDNTVEELTGELDSLIESMKEYNLPKNREEFEDRATLYSLLHSLSEFLQIKKDYINSND